MYLISFYVPETHLESVKSALFEAGAGQIGAYSHCAWQVRGEGQFMPMAGSNAWVGEINQVETLPEFKVEMVCHPTRIQAVIAALKKHHPYETPAYHVLQCASFVEQP